MAFQRCSFFYNPASIFFMFLISAFLMSAASAAPLHEHSSEIEHKFHRLTADQTQTNYNTLGTSSSPSPSPSPAPGPIFTTISHGAQTDQPAPSIAPASAPINSQTLDDQSSVHMNDEPQLIGGDGCSLQAKMGSKLIQFANCNSLGSIQGASLRWTLHDDQQQLDVHFHGMATKPSGWVAWGINPGPAPAMIGTQAFVAFTLPSNATGSMPTLQTYNVQKGSKMVPSSISLDVIDKHVEMTNADNGQLRVEIFVSLRLQPGQSTVLNHVWARGDSIVNYDTYELSKHGFSAEELSGLLQIDMAGRGTANKVSPNAAQSRLKKAHGILNILSWDGILVLGCMQPRYARLFDLPFIGKTPNWFHIHRALQSIGGTLALCGAITGIVLAVQGNGASFGATFTAHKIVGYGILCALVAQIIMATCFRPDKNAGRKRTIWFAAHRTLAFLMLGMGWANTWTGLHMQHGYTKLITSFIVAILPAMLILSLALELLRFIVDLIISRKRHSTESQDHVVSDA